MTGLRLAFCLFAYRPYGGLQRDFFRIAQLCAQRGHRVDVFTMEWQCPVPDGFRVHVLPVRRLRNHKRSKQFSRLVAGEVRKQSFDAVIGFNRIQGLDIYYAADPCYVAKVRELHGPLYRLSGRYQHFAAMERALFSTAAKTRILLLSEQEIPKFISYYHTQRERLQLLPPGIARDRQAPAEATEQREHFRNEHQLKLDDRLILMVGSGFRTKGLDRAIRALASLPAGTGQQCILMVVGEDKEGPFRRQATRLGVMARVRFMQGRDDVTQFMLGADLLIHPAYSENTGTVLLEAMIAGLPVLATDVCGYACHIERAQAGRVIPSPFAQSRLNSDLAEMLNSPERRQWSENGIRYGLEEDLYSMPDVAADYIEQVARRND